MLTPSNDAAHNITLELSQSFITSSVFLWFLDNNIFEEIDRNSNHETKELALQLSIDYNTFERFLRLLSANSILKKNKGRYSLNISLQEILALKSLELSKLYNDINDILMNTQLKKEMLDEEAITLNHILDLLYNYKGTHLQVVFMFIISRIIIFVSTIDLESIIGSGLTIKEFSNHLHMPIDTVNRLARLLCDHYIINLDHGIIKNNTLTKTLPWVLTPHITESYNLFSHIDYTIRNNESAWSYVYGSNFYGYLSSNPVKSKIFNNWCSLSAVGWLEAVLLWCKFPKSKIVIDIGGGSGSFIQKVLDLNPEIDGVLFDQESTINNIDPLYFSKYENRIDLVSGDFFNDRTIPPNGDIYIICRTLLNWSNNDAVTIINNCASRMPKHAKIIIVDFIIPDITHPKYQRAVLNDISLYTIMDSGIRTKAEWMEIISKTKLHLISFKMTNEAKLPNMHKPYYPMCFIELSLDQ